MNILRICKVLCMYSCELILQLVMTTHRFQVESGTFTVTNLGAYGVKNYAPIVRMPQACALAIGVAEDRVIPNEGKSTLDV